MGCNFKPCCAGICGLLAAIAILIALILPFWFVSQAKEESAVFGVMKGKETDIYGLSAVVAYEDITAGCSEDLLAFICEGLKQQKGKPQSCKGKCDGDKGELTLVYARKDYIKNNEDGDSKIKCKSGDPALAILSLSLIMALGAGILAIVVAFKPMKMLKFAATGLAAGALVFCVIGVAVGVTSSSPLNICVSSDSKIQKDSEDAIKKNNNLGPSISAYIGIVGIVELLVALILLVVSVLMHNSESGFSQVDK